MEAITQADTDMSTVEAGRNLVEEVGLLLEDSDPAFKRTVLRHLKWPEFTQTAYKPKRHRRQVSESDSSDSEDYRRYKKRSVKSGKRQDLFCSYCRRLDTQKRTVMH